MPSRSHGRRAAARPRAVVAAAASLVLAFGAGAAVTVTAMSPSGSAAETVSMAASDAASAAAPAVDPAPPTAPPDVRDLPLPNLGPAFQAAEDLKDGTKLAAWRMISDVKTFQLEVAELDWATKPGVIKKALAINGTIPAPTIRVNEGDRVRLIVHNRMKEPTSIHWHGMDLPNGEDGVPGITQKEIAPGATYTYEWTAISPGTHWYHSHMHGEQEGRGLYGALEVVPAAGDIKADRDYRIIVGDGPLGFVFNGRSFPATRRLPARVGERVHIRLIGAGPNLIHSIHLHSGFFQVVAQDGRRLREPYEADTIVLGVGQTYDLIWVPTRVGYWMIHCHIFAHSETKSGMTGMVTLMDVSPATAVTAPQVPGTGDVNPAGQASRADAAAREPGA